jgi:PhnB protein
MIVQAYLMFNGRCQEAVDFYTKAVGAQTEMVMKFSDSPESCGPAGVPPECENYIMHCSFKIGQTSVMASDGMAPYTKTPKFEGITLSLAVKTVADQDKYFGALSEGGKVTMPAAKTFFSEKFGMLIDKFGVSWMVLVSQECGS